MARDDILEVLVRNRKKAFYEGYAKSVSSRNEKGSFDVLPLHANFITLIKDNIMVLKEDDEKFEIKIEKGVLKVHNNRVDVYLDIDAV